MKKRRRKLKMKIVYLDNAATTKMSDKVIEEMKNMEIRLLCIHWDNGQNQLWKGQDIL